MKTVILFTDIKYNPQGKVTLEGGKLTGSNEFAQEMIDFYIDRGMTPEEWIKKFSSWNNGYIYSAIVK